jgi:RND family efflux transporter MFP subunit
MKILEILRNKKYLTVIAVVAIIVVGFIVYKFVFSNKNQNQNVFVVQKSDIVQEVTVTGQVRKGDKINLAFLNSGRLKSVFVKVGDKVEKGDVLARLDIRDLEIQLEEARAGLALAESKLDKLLAGKTQEEILLAETKVLNAQKSLEESQKTLGKTKILAEQSLQSYYETGLDDIRGAYLKADNAYNDIDPIKRNYFHFYDLVSVRVQDAVKVIGEKRDALNSELSSVNSNSSGSEIEKVLQNSEDNLEAISDALSIIRSSCEDSSYRSLISSADKTTIDTHRSYINTILASIRTDKSNIFTTKATNELNIAKAENSVATYQASLDETIKNLDVLKAKPREEDVNYAEAEVNQMKASASLLEKKIIDSNIFAPISGQIVEINKEIGEIVSLTDGPVFVEIADLPFEIEIDVSEVDSAKLKVGNRAEIVLDALPNEKFSGEIIEIDPAGKEISGVIYYKTKVSLTSDNPGIRPEMTANVTIFTASKEQVLVIPLNALIFKEDKKVVRVFVGKEIKEIEIETGIMDSKGFVEIISGLKEGDKLFFVKK